MEEQELLKVEQLTVSFKNNVVVDSISFSLKEGEILGIVGESGSGKTMTSLAIADLLKEEAKVSGHIFFRNQDFLTMSEKERRQYKGNEVAMIFQEPMTSLNPVMKIGKQVEEMLKLHSNFSAAQLKEQTLHVLEEVGLKEANLLYNKYPHQLSGGMRQRVVIAISIICKPKLIIADEPTTALDVTIQAQILQLLKQINQQYRTSIIFISHDLGVIKNICSRVLVMKDGSIVESNEINPLFSNPQTNYTKELLKAVGLTSNLYLKDGKLNASKKNYVIVNKTDDCSSLLNQKVENKLLTIKNLYAFYEDKKGGLWRKTSKKQVLNGLSLSVRQGEIVGIVGESGSGKSTLAKVMVGLIKDYKGEIQCQDLKPQMVFQDPYSSLNPMRTIGWILEESLKINTSMSKQERIERVDEMLLQVDLKKEYKTRNSSMLSGGQRQRVAIALALMLNPKLVILDEPVSALDVTVQAQILTLLLKLRETYQLSYVFISHDLNVVRQICDRVIVLYQGNMIEEGTIQEIYNNPKENYTKNLLKSIM